MRTHSIPRSFHLTHWFFTRRGGVIAAALAAAVIMRAVPPASASEDPVLKSTPDDQQSISITIYNDNLGLVKDVRKIKLPRGVINLNFEGVAAQIDPTSVHIRSLTSPKLLTILEQNFEFDLISPQKLAEKYLGRTVELVTTNKDDGKEVWTKAKLIGIQGGYVYEIDGKIAVNPPGRIVLPSIPEGLISRPTLVWMLDNGRDEQTVEASYLTSGIGWKSNYVLVLSKDDKQMDLAGWVTINNQSGATYADAAIKLVAGDVNRIQPERPVIAGMAKISEARAPQFAEQAFFEYHLYTLQRPSTIKDNQTKQISLLDAKNASVKKTYVYSPAVPYWFSAYSGPDKNTKVGVFLSFKNSKDNNLGMALPKGVVRVYKKDDDDALQFIGEDAIDHTPVDETVRVKMGEAFDVVGERTQTDFTVLDSGHLYESSYKIELRNHKEDDIVVSVIEAIPGDWTVTKKSHEYVKESSNRIRFDVPVAGKGSSTLTYTVRIRY
jgi:hypothetical protein